MIFPADELETERLKLRRPTLRDAKEIFERYAQDSDVARYVLWRPAKEQAETELFLRQAIDAWDIGVGHRPWVIETEGRLIGMIGITILSHRAEVGYVLAKAEWGHGFMTEALRCIIEHCFTSPDIDRVWAVADVDNEPSWRVMERAGMRFEGILRGWARHPGVGNVPRDCRCYAAVRDSPA